MKNKLQALFNSTLALTQLRVVAAYRVTYAPEQSERPELPIQVYTIVGNPKKLAWRSQAGNKLFTALMPRRNRFASFRADRTLSVNFAGWRILSPAQAVSYRKTLTTVAA